MTAATSSFQTIMETAAALIEEKGCRQTTLQDIIKRTGLSKGAIYHYVKSKDELFGLVLKSRIESINQRFNEAVHSPGTPGLERPLQMIADGMIRSTSHADVTNKIFIYLLSQTDQPDVAETVKEVYGFTLKTCGAWIDAGKRAGFIPETADGGKLAESLVTYMYGMRVQSAITRQPSPMTVQDLIRLMTRTLT
jgi:AcrR family transcriptional regulator